LLTGAHALLLQGRTPLIYACERGHDGIVDALLREKANVNIKGYNNYTALHYACMNNFISIAKKLVNNGADIDLPDKVRLM
jgi:ankyrin repeat protein